MTMETASAESSREGQLLVGKYKLEKHLGSGAMGDVYRAQNVMLGRIVAIKLLRPEHANNQEIVKRFMVEAQAANLVRHPNVVDMLDVGTDERGSPFIVQEFLQGQDFSAYIESRGGKLDPAEAIDLLLPVVQAIEYAHARGVIHRDLKPENIFLAQDNGRVVPKLLDFGISQVRSADSVRMTATGLMMGTPAYMSPEQIVRGAREADAQTDVWALGVILYEVLAGELPFMAETASALFVDIATRDAAPLSNIDPSMPPTLVKIVERCLRRERADRYPSGCELARDLRHWMNDEAVEATGMRSIPPPAPQGPPRTAKAAAALANMDIPSLGVGPRTKEVVRPDKPIPQPPGLATPSSPKVKAKAKDAPRMPTMQEVMEDGGDFDDDDDDKPNLELDVPVSHKSYGGMPAVRPSGQMNAVQPASRKGSGLDVAPPPRMNMPDSVTGGVPLSNRVPQGFHAAPVSSQRQPGYGGNLTGYEAPGEPTQGFSLNDVVGYTSLALGGIAAAGAARFGMHHESSALRPLLEPLKGQTLFVIPAILCMAGAGFAAWKAGKAMQDQSKYFAGFLAVVSGIAFAAGLEFFGTM